MMPPPVEERRFVSFDGTEIAYQAVGRGRPILLCWEQSEPSVGFWHEVSGGYVGRQPVPPNLPEWPRVSAATAALE